ncbi:MAG: carboxypeptidase-like regulatory domain-containing protein, partial [Sediminibacterium sp.]
MFQLHPNLGCGSHSFMELPDLKINASQFQFTKFKLIPTKMLMGLLLVLGIALFQTNLTAQNAPKPVSGKVLGANNQPLEGVTISQKGGTKMTLTDKEGKFSISVPGNATLNFSYVGYVAKQELVNNRSEINLSLVQENAVPEEVVVIGYQTIKRKNLLASVSSVSAKDLKDIPVNSAAEALNGRLAGVSATTAEGSPDADVRVRIRGGMSIT